MPSFHVVVRVSPALIWMSISSCPASQILHPLSFNIGAERVVSDLPFLAEQSEFDFGVSGQSNPDEVLMKFFGDIFTSLEEMQENKLARLQKKREEKSKRNDLHAIYFA